MGGVVTVLLFLLYIALVALVTYGAYWALGWVGCPEQLRRILTVIVCLLMLLGGAYGWTEGWFAPAGRPVIR